MSKFTNSPWIMCGPRDKDADMGCFRIKDEDGRSIADVWFLSRMPQEEGEANAHLIADAPALLEALESIVSDFEGCYADGEPAIIKARALIAKHGGGV